MCVIRLILVLLVCGSSAIAQEPLKLLFLGDHGPHKPIDRFNTLAPTMAAKGIDLSYTDDADDLNEKTLNRYDGLIVYANITEISAEQEAALLNYVVNGGGFVPLHCASYCFLNSAAYVELVGAQFKKHGGQVFGTEIAQTHPLTTGFSGFRSWDETYIHTRHNDDRTVLEYRVEGVQADGFQREPWTWIRTHGKGRVFYTAWGHDLRTWSNSGFQNLIERGIRWVCHGDPTLAGPVEQRTAFQAPEMTSVKDAVKPTFVEVGVKIPNYKPSEKWGQQGPPLTQMPAPLSPADSLTHISVPVGMKATLFASESQLASKPIAMNWDERGRLWVCETVDYPNELQPVGQGRDKIEICEDTNGDGQADKFTVFAENLSIPTAILPFQGGAIVQDGTRTLFLKDTDGDDRADLSHVLIDGWALGDTHGGVSNFHYGHDNWIWAMQGYNASTPLVEGQPQQSFRMGFFRFRLSNSETPQVEELEFLRSTNNNTWGLGFTEDFLVFGSTANRNPSTYMSIANRYYERVRGWSPQQLGSIADTHMFNPIADYIRQVDHHGGYTAAAGHAIYAARRYPQTYWNRTAFVCGPTGHLVGTFVLSAQGSDFTSTSPANLFASTDGWCAPIMAEVGPDGNVWVLDWYNYIVQHNPTPQGFTTGKGNAYESDLRDKRHGRIYRIDYPSAEDDEMPRLTMNVPETLVATLKHTNMFWRKQAQRLLVQRAQRDVVPALIELTRDTRTDAIGLNVGVIHALWTLKGLGALETASGPAFEAVVQCLQHPSGGVVRNAVMVLPHEARSIEAIAKAGVSNHSQMIVRLAALLAIADTPSSSLGNQLITAALSDPALFADAWLPDALTSAATTGGLSLLTSLLSEQVAVVEPARAVIARLAEHVARGAPSSNEFNLLISMLAAGSPNVLQPTIDGLAAGWPQEHAIQLTDANERKLRMIVARLPSAQQAKLVQLGMVWGSQQMNDYSIQIAKRLLAEAMHAAADEASRINAAKEVIGFLPENKSVIEPLLQLVDPLVSPTLAIGILEALGQSPSAIVADGIIHKIESLTPSIRQAALQQLLRRPHWTRMLLDAAQAGRTSLTSLTLEQKQTLTNHPELELRRLAAKLLAGGGIPDENRMKVVAAMLHITEKSGDVDRGKQVFSKQCGHCHKHGQIGQEIGPDLTGMAVHPKEELLIHILDPSRSVEGNYRAYSVLTTDGRVFTGMLASESRTAIEIIDTAAKRHVLPREDIEMLKSSRKSVMPEGFESQIPQEGFIDLLEFLTHRGQYTSLNMRLAATVASDQPMFTGRNPAERLVFPEWGRQIFEGIPFQVLDPRGGKTSNVIMLHGPRGTLPPKMPKEVSLAVNQPVKTVHLLSGIGGWASQTAKVEGSTSMLIRIDYADGESETHELKDGLHFADYIGSFEVPGSRLAFVLEGRQVRYLAINPKRQASIKQLSFIKGSDGTAPIVVAVTVEQ